MFTNLLISTCDIQEKAQVQSGYEKVLEWANILTGVRTRKDSSNSPSITDVNIRINTDDDIFYFDADINVKRGNRIVFDSEYYDVLKVNKSYDSVGVHHLEVVARLVDHK